MFNTKSEKSVEIAVMKVVAAGELAGAAALIWRDGEVVDVGRSGAVTWRVGFESSATPSSASRR
jgi:hypothetical protein